MHGGSESSKQSGVTATERVDAIGESLTDSGVQTNTDDSLTEGRQTQTRTELELHTQHEITSDGQDQSTRTLLPYQQAQQTLQPTISTHKSIERHSDTQPEPKSQTEPTVYPQPDTLTARNTAQQLPSQPINPNARPPTPPLPCTLYSPPSPSTIYSSSSESDSESCSSTGRSLPNNIPLPPTRLPSPVLLRPKTMNHGTFTKLRNANLEVLEVFKQLTRPERARIEDVSYWQKELLPEAERLFKEATKGVDCDEENGEESEDDDGETERERKEREAWVDDRGLDQRPITLEWEPDTTQLFKWRFRRIEVWVQKLELKGPKDLGGLEVKMPKGCSGSSVGQKKAYGTATGSGSSSPAAAGAGNGNDVRAETRTGTGRTAKVKVITTSPKTAAAPNNTPATTQEQWKHYNNVRPIVTVKTETEKKKRRRRPTRAEKGKGKAVDPVAATEGSGKGAEQGIVDMWAGEFGEITSEEGECSEEE
ncbi:hypothetical protein B0T09DRAFT_356416 [Sordaria sp. MPI-SDFR-AT-0083]|nr:hypothetical protein B0T09DRAFT_356416 [Sordaria sp. MPI-SDFR-AT-0083]